MSGKSLTYGMVMRALETAYDLSIKGNAIFDSAYELAESYQKRGGTKLDQANEMIGWQIIKAGTSGFLSGLEGAFTIPLNIASVLAIQMRMSAAIAIIGGYDPYDDQVKSFVYLTMVGNELKDVAKAAGIKIGKRMAEQYIKRKVTREALVAINRKVGLRLVTKFGEKGIINLGKAIPLVGGFIGGVFDAVTTDAVGNAAIKVFITG